jgi:hypothetical protein
MACAKRGPSTCRGQCMRAGSKAVVASLAADRLERDIHVAARRMRVGTDCLGCFPYENGEIGRSNARVLDLHLHR